MRWQGESIGALESQPIRLRFATKEVDLYSLRFR